MKPYLKLYFCAAITIALLLLIYGFLVPPLVSQDNWIDVVIGIMIAVAFPAGAAVFVNKSVTTFMRETTRKETTNEKD